MPGALPLLMLRLTPQGARLQVREAVLRAAVSSCIHELIMLPSLSYLRRMVKFFRRWGGSPHTDFVGSKMLPLPCPHPSLFRGALLGTPSVHLALVLSPDCRADARRSQGRGSQAKMPMSHREAALNEFKAATREREGTWHTIIPNRQGR